MKLNANSRKNIRVVKLLFISLIFVAIAASIAVVGCNYISNRNFKETFYSVSSLKVNNKIRVIQLSDLHNCRYGAENEKLLHRTEKLTPDLILLTGDILDSKTEDTSAVVTLCKRLAEIAPTYFIYGNNEVEKFYTETPVVPEAPAITTEAATAGDYYKEKMETAAKGLIQNSTKAEKPAAEPLTQESLDERFGFTDETRDPQKLLELTDDFTTKLEQAGVHVLKNRTETITVGTTKVDIFGVLTSNPSAFWSYAGSAFDAFIYENESNLKITAIHEPHIFETYTPDSWGDLMLAGHTHGGTVKIPLIGPLYTHGGGLLPERSGCYVYGRYDVQGRPLIVSGGLENKNIFRINNSPELVIVDINKF